ncbi:CLUMA_CG020120, isoform A [Clunio marinus]|uniref:CLUMA_CG020120, isoform A n=1 Tax=Clunio marinus TaxID=568069 RepID=A0A1J1J5R6_9DIPT|nr:CLUMA_CG020120, isoform A [Clunio marinus]
MTFNQEAESIFTYSIRDDRNRKIASFRNALYGKYAGVENMRYTHKISNQHSRRCNQNTRLMERPTPVAKYLKINEKEKKCFLWVSTILSKN